MKKKSQIAKTEAKTDSARKNYAIFDRSSASFLSVMSFTADELAEYKQTQPQYIVSSNTIDIELDDIHYHQITLEPNGTAKAINHKEIIKIKQAKLAELDTAYNQAKTITIKDDDTTLTLTAEDKEYKILLEIVEESKLVIDRQEKKRFWSIKNGIKYEIYATAQEWKDKFSNFLVSRVHNKSLFDTYQYQITNALDKEKLQDIHIGFDNIEGYIVILPQRTLIKTIL